MPLISRWVPVLLASLIGAALVAAPARADSPMRLDGQVTDEVGALDGREPEVTAALDRLRDANGLQLFVVYVRSFDGTPAQEWADETATRSDLGQRDAVLAVATRDRSYAYAFDAGYPLTDAQLDSVAAVAIEPALRENDWAGAAIGAADGYRAVLAGQPVRAPAITPGDPDPNGGGSGSFALGAVICLVIPAVLIGLVVWLVIRARRRRPQATPTGPPPVSTAELTTRANALLVELDNDLRASEQELSLATGRYGAEATASFTAALESARQDVAEAFRLRLTLDETPEPDEPARRAALEEIIRRCEAADQRLDAESEAFDELRGLESRIEPERLELSERCAAAEAKLPTTGTTIEALRGRYTGPVVAGVLGNADQARERLEFAETTLAGVQLADPPRAALALRAAEEAVAQAETLIDTVSRTQSDLDSARAGIDALIAEVESELAAVPPDAGAAVAAAQQALASTRAALAQPTMDPLSAVQALEQADAALDRALAEQRDAAERAARARGMLDHALPAARAEVSAAGSFIATRRGAVASQARASLGEAQRLLARAEALATTDPVAAVADAQRAQQLAAEAGRSAQSDVHSWSSGSTSDLLTGILLGGIMSGGGHRSGGGFRGGGFGGSGSRARRTGGGRF
ncbi:TPM domain-containing protein [Phytohabitans aurantiacus]|uniref:Membrane protein n=1 Tax=Phytohabitans aurantiacus TaxID=3016789 RepID=A0ABQ5QNI0_9ACTN|nr:TPM domain-containing protein [Phytohabitans aurantiacus]GLH95825.1 membrane protein [Phytohabitans aurantiacus]